MTKILIVDDAAFMRMNLKNLLEEAGFEVIGEAENGETAVEKYKSLSPDLVTLDINMPVMDGLTALEEIMLYDKNARIIICSAVGQRSLAFDALKMGAKDFIAKPFARDEVIEAVLKYAR